MSKYSEAGKGSSTRRSEVSEEVFSNNWDRIFKRTVEDVDLRCTEEMKAIDGPCDSCSCPQ